jgi:hypothetical protein
MVDVEEGNIVDMSSSVYNCRAICTNSRRLWVQSDEMLGSSTRVYT